MAKLILIRHGESKWNAKGLWTGWKDIPLSDKGKEEARKIGEAIRDLPFDVCFTSELTRAQQTLSIILETLGRSSIQIIRDKAINERNYGDYTGKNKWDIQKELGEEVFLKIRRSWDYPIPNGESLKQVSERAYPYFQEVILPYLLEGKSVLLVAHGNSIRSLMKQLEHIPDDKIAEVEIETGEAIVYTLDSHGSVIEKQHVKTN